MKRALLCPIVTVVAAVACMAAPALASAATHKQAHKKAKTVCCVRHFHFAAGPYHVKPGSNSIFISFANVPKPNIDGYMIKMVPNLHYAKANGKCCGPLPLVSILHLHHGVWLSNGQLGVGEGNGQYGGIGYPFMATGEEKTHYILPPGYGYPVQAKDRWAFNYMIHDLIPAAATVYVTYEVDFVPANTPLAKTITAVHPIWMDVEDHQLYPVFNVMKGSGKNGKFTFPYMAKNPYGIHHPLNQFTVDQPGTLVATAGHVHPGGLYTELDDTRAATAPSHGAKPGIAPGSVRLFRSYAHYWDKRGPISWDMAMQGTAPDWRPHINAGDTLSVSATYDSKRASWYEAMGIMVVWEAWDSQRGIDVFTGKPQTHTAAVGVSGINPFIRKLDQKGYLTHGHLAENDDNGGSFNQYNVNLKKLKPCKSAVVDVSIHHFAYSPGGFSSSGSGTCIPTIQAGSTLTFTNQDAPNSNQGFLFPDTPYGDAIFHTVTSCTNPCELNSAISYPLANVADLAGGYDSGQLGLATPGTGGLKWSTPTSLKPGLYTYFCRIHPFMRGVFRVVG